MYHIYTGLCPGFYSSPSCDGDLNWTVNNYLCFVSILPRLATGIPVKDQSQFYLIVSILPRLATGIDQELYPPRPLKVSILPRLATGIDTQPVSGDSTQFLFFPVLRRGSAVFHQ